MKTTRIILLVLGILLIVFQGLGYVGAAQRGPLFEGQSSAYIFGFNLPGLLGVIMLLIALRLGRKLRERKEREQLDVLLKTPDSQLK